MGVARGTEKYEALDSIQYVKKKKNCSFRKTDTWLFMRQ